MSRRLTVLATATVMATVAMLAMAGLAWAQQQEEQPGAITTATEETTATGEDTTTAEQDSSSTAAPLVAPTASKNLKIEPKKPKPGSKTKDRTPLIKAKVTQKNTDGNNKLKKNDIKLYLDGDKKGNFTYKSGKGLLEFTPENNLSFDKHTVKVVAKGGQGQKEREKWSFKVVE